MPTAFAVADYMKLAVCIVWAVMCCFQLHLSDSVPRRRIQGGVLLFSVIAFVTILGFPRAQLFEYITWRLHVIFSRIYFNASSQLLCYYMVYLLSRFTYMISRPVGSRRNQASMVPTPVKVFYGAASVLHLMANLVSSTMVLVLDKVWPRFILFFANVISAISVFAFFEACLVKLYNDLKQHAAECEESGGPTEMKTRTPIWLNSCATSSVASPKIQLASTKMQFSYVASQKLQLSSVASPKLQLSYVASPKLQLSSSTSPKLQLSSVASPKLQLGSGPSPKMKQLSSAPSPKTQLARSSRSKNLFAKVRDKLIVLMIVTPVIGLLCSAFCLYLAMEILKTKSDAHIETYSAYYDIRYGKDTSYSFGYVQSSPIHAEVLAHIV